MADPDTPAANPSKRRRLQPRSNNSAPRYSSPDELGGDDFPTHSVSVVSRPSSASGPGKTARRVSIRRGRTPSRSPSPDELQDVYYSRSASRSRSRTRNRSRRLSRSGSRDTSDSRRRSRSGGRSSGSSRSRSRSSSRSRSRSRDGSRSRSRSQSRQSRSESRSRTPSRSRSGSESRSRSGSSSRTTSPTKPPPYQAARPAFRPKFILRGHTHSISQVRISPDGCFIASASADGTIRTWNAETGAHMDTLVGHLAGVSCIAWSPDSCTIASGSDDKAIRLWDRVTGRPKMSAKGGRRGRAAKNGGVDVVGPMRPLLGHHNYIHCLAFSPKGNILASGSYDEAVFLWDVRAGRLMRSLPAHSDPVSGIDFCRDGTLVASCSTDGLVRVWDTSTGQCLRTLVHEDNPAVTNVCFSPNGHFVLAFTLDNCIRLWDYVAGSVKKTYQGHKNEKFAIGGCFATSPRPKDPDTKPSGTSSSHKHKPRNTSDENVGQAIIASASEDGSILLWDVKSKAVVQKLKGHEGVCFWVDVCRGIMASAGQDGVIRVYRDRNWKDEAPMSDVEREKLAEKVSELEVKDNDEMEDVEMTADVQIKQEEAEAEADAMKVDDASELETPR